MCPLHQFITSVHAVPQVWAQKFIFNYFLQYHLPSVDFYTFLFSFYSPFLYLPLHFFIHRGISLQSLSSCFPPSLFFSTFSSLNSLAFLRLYFFALPRFTALPMFRFFPSISKIPSCYLPLRFSITILQSNSSIFSFLFKISFLRLFKYICPFCSSHSNSYTFLPFFGHSLIFYLAFFPPFFLFFSLCWEN